jgi:regulation of enolase protein 1 (concanavalin A-like superfamily)/plastocyanin
VSEPDLHRNLQPIVAFAEWTKAYLDAPDKAALVPEGFKLAEARRPVFKQLIQDDPRRALQDAVPPLTRQELPASIVALLEQRVAASGVMRVYQASPDSATRGEKPQLRYVETKQGETYQAYVFGRRAASVDWVPQLSAVGVALDGQLALDDRPLYVMQPGEIPPAELPRIEVCPVSKITTPLPPTKEPITNSTPAVIANGEVVSFCDGSHIAVFEQLLIQSEAGTGGAQSFTGILPSAPTPSVGVVKVLYIPVIFPDINETPITDAGAQDVMRQSSAFYQTMSFGRLTLVATVTPPVRMPKNRAWYVGKDTTSGFIKEIDGLGLEMSHAKEAALKLGYDWQDYHATVVRANGGARAPTSYGGGGNVWMRTDSVGTTAHEVGHAFGLAHANFWETNGASVIGPGGNVEYGDNYDNMGPSAAPPNGHYNIQAKNQVKWLPDEFAPAITSSGTYRLYRMDQPTLETGKRYGLRIKKDNDRTYWGEYRLLGGNNWTNNGMLLGWKWPNNSGGNIQLLDTTPGSVNGKSDAGITVGRTFSDNENGIHITTLSVNSTTPASLDMVVNLGTFPTNQAPTLVLSPAATVVPTNTNVTFTATASDADSDTLAYSWQWHDNVISPSGPTATRSFSTAGVYTLSCVVSDMKGGIAVRNAVITVGNGGGMFTISGRITRNGGGIPNVTVGTGGANGTLTDSDGYYTISNLAAGNYSVAPAEHGLVFNEVFNNSITVGPSFSGADFTVDELPEISIAATTPTSVEGGAAGNFRISRTGSTSVSQTVFVFNQQGSATKGTSTTNDYYFSPDFTTGTPFNSFTIPANSAFLDISVPSRNEGTSEGYETVTLVLGSDTSYVLGAQNTATIAIQDANTVLPRVSLSLNEQQTMENSAPLIVTATRTGATTAALTVPYTTASLSTATSGSDYTALTGSIVIPIGVASASFNLTPLDDTESEQTETVTLSIATGASFIADVGASTVTARILDDDAQTISVTAADTTAVEVDRATGTPNPGTFIVTRTGSTAAPVTVFYSVAGVALHGTDYDALPGSVIIPAGQTQASITIMPKADSFAEGSETVILGLGAGFGFYQFDSNSTATLSIADAPTDMPLLEVTAYSSFATEPSTNGTFRFTAKGGAAGALTVNYTITGTATAGSDYNITGLNTTTLTGSTTITLTGGTITSNLTVTTVNDASLEALENITLTISPSANYSLWDPLAKATMFLRDDDHPTVFVDAQVGTGSSDTVSESSTSTALEFFVSRTGSTTNPLTVNYTMGGTATAGTDYTNTNLTGSVVIPAGSAGVDVGFNTISDTLFEGTESIIFQLAAGSYASGGNSTMLITDDDAGTQNVSFASPGNAGSESTTAVSIPVTLNAPATVPVSVEYNMEAGARNTTFLHGTWVRIDRTGTSYVTSTSPDGTTWTAQSSTRTITMSSANYLAGIYVTSGSATNTALATIDNVSITGLSAGGSAGTMTSAEIGSSSPKGGNQVNGGVYQITGGGPDVGTSSSDGCRFVYFPITNSANCTIIARVVNLTGPSTPKAGVMIRESTAAGAIRMAFHTNTASPSQAYRTTTNGGGSSGAGALPTFTKPQWLRLARSGNAFTASTSPDGTTFTPVGGSQTLALSTQLLVGMAASSRNDGTLAQATFDNVTLSPAPSTAYQDRTVGYVNEQGYSTSSSGTYVITASGSGIMPTAASTEDEAHFLMVPVVGDFTFTTRLTALSLTGAHAGIMVREGVNYRARAAWFGLNGNASSSIEWRARLSATESGEGFGVDYSLPPGVLNFAVGEQTKHIILTINNDNLIEPMEFVNVLLKNPSAAVLGGGSSTFTYTIVDDDVVSGLPAAGFAAPTSSGLETVSPAQIAVVLSEAPAGGTSVDYAITAGTATDATDFTAATGTLNFSAGQTFATIPLTVLDDSDVEVGETVTLTLSNPVGIVLSTSATHTFTITDDDTPLVTITASDATATEDGDTGAFSITRTGPATSALIVNFIRSGTAANSTDFTAITSPGAVTIPIGQASADVTVTPVNNTTPEAPETVILALSAGTGYTVGSPSTATVTINDDDVNTVSLTAPDALASETAGNDGSFQLTRSGPTTAALMVNLTISGTATSGTDYTALTTAQTFAIGASSITIPVSILQDSTTEGDEVILASLNASGGYINGVSAIASISIADDDLPPTVFVSSPASKSTIIANGNGLMLTATAEDDGLPSALTYAWTQLFGPGTTTFGTAAAASTSATFSAPGVYGLRITVSDGQFSVSDDIFVQSGGFNYATWMTQDQGPPATRGIAGESSGVFTLIGSGTGYTTASDSGHMLFRQLFTAAGDATIIARLTTLTGPSTRLAGITLRDTSWKGGKRVNLMLDGTGTVQFRQRAALAAADTATTISGAAAPLWLKLERVSGTITASHAPDVSGAPGTWVSDGTSTVGMNKNLIVGMVVSAGTSTSATATAVFDNVSVTPAITGTALHSEDIGNYPLAGSSSDSAGTVTITAYGTYDGSGGHFRYQQIWGDCVVTARLTNHNGSSRGAQSGVGLRDTTDVTAHAFYGNTSVDGYQVHWRSTPSGSNGSLQSSGTGYIRLVRKGNIVNAYKASSIAGPWTLNSGNLPVVLTGPLQVGLVVDANSTTVSATGTFTNFSVVPINTAPVVDTGTLAALAPFNLNATITDDGQPTPPGATTSQWSLISGPGTVTFANPAVEDTLATLSLNGAYTLRLSADDGDAMTFKDLAFTGYNTPFAQWLGTTNAGNANNTLAEATADADGDGLLNLLEYAVGTNGTVINASPQVLTLAPVSTDKYIRLSIPKNSAATDVTFIVEACSDLVSWSSAGLITETNTSTQLIVRDNVPVSPNNQRFMRVRVTRP